MSAQITQLTCQLACRVLSRVYKVDSNGAHNQLLSTSENGCCVYRLFQRSQTLVNSAIRPNERVGVVTN